MPEYLDFMRQRLGANWVLARRTDRILRQYGEDVNCVTKRWPTCARGSSRRAR
jgi:hypothetical protein